MVNTTRPVITGKAGVVSSGHYLSAAAGVKMLAKGGNAIDAGVAAGFALAVLKPNENTLGGECPILVYSEKHKKVFSISGQGVAPKKATAQWFADEKIDMIPGDGYLGATVPGMFGSYCAALKYFGRLTLADVLEPALDLAENGFPVFGSLRAAIQGNAKKFAEQWPSSAAVFMPGGEVPKIGAILKQPALASVIKELIELEKEFTATGWKEFTGAIRKDGAAADRKDGFPADKRGGIDVVNMDMVPPNRNAAIDSVIQYFYNKIADEIVEYTHSFPVKDATGRYHTSLLEKEDFLHYATRVEEPVFANYRNFEVFKCGPWTQGPVFLQQLKLLEGFDLRGMAHNSAEYVHVVTECAKLAFADRERYYGDPLFSEIPMDMLLSDEYNEMRRKEIDVNAANNNRMWEVDPDESGTASGAGGSDGMGEAGMASGTDEADKANGTDEADGTGDTRGNYTGDTTHLDVADCEGNMMSATPSGGWIPSSPVIPNLGFPIGTRGQMFNFTEGHPNCLQPGKRPRTTLTPSLAFKDGRPWMAFGTPGGDCQDQWALQFFLNAADFNMDIQQAIDKPSFYTNHFVNSFYPRAATIGVVYADKDIGVDEFMKLQDKGHTVNILPSGTGGQVTAVCLNRETGLIEGAASAKGDGRAYAMGW